MEKITKYQLFTLLAFSLIFLAFYFGIENKRVANIFIGKPEKFRYIVSTNEKVANEIITSEDKIQTILLHYKNNDINVKAIRLQDKIKLSFAKIFLKSL